MTTVPQAKVDAATQAYGAIRDGALNMLGMEAVPGSALKLSPFRVSETAIHDFTQYVFLRDPNDFVGASLGQGLAQSSLVQFLQDAATAINDVVEAGCSRELDVGTYRLADLTPLFPEFKATIYQLFLTYVGGFAFELASRVSPSYPGTSGDAHADVLNAFSHWLTVLVLEAKFDQNSLAASFDDPVYWQNAEAEVLDWFKLLYPGAAISAVSVSGSDSYSFSPFPTGLVNFGLRLVFRQEWRPLGTQPGEIVRTIPLGPKQTERVTTKVVMTQRENRSSETSSSTETSTEASEATKESSDVVTEASSSLKWHVDAEASANVGFVTAKLSAGVAGDTANSSKDSKGRLNETMQKTASKMRRDVKVVVSTERNLTQETDTFSEITNPNDEVAITYVYSKLQRQYEILTTLAEVNSVVFVPESMPKWSEVDEGWIRRNDWIIAKALLDESFSADLADLAREPEEEELGDPSDLIASGASTATNSIEKYKDFQGGGALPDIFSSLQAGYQRHIEAKRGIAMNKKRRSQRSSRLIRHIQDNILHYMRAVWSQEDADQRLRRYSTILVPTRWTFTPFGPVDPALPELEVEGEFLPDLGPQSIRPLTDVINPAGPVGYTANYAVYYLRGDPQLLDLNGALSYLRAQYVRFIVKVDIPAVQSVAIAPRYRRATYKITFVGAGNWTGVHVASGAAVTVEGDASDSSIRFDGLLVQLVAAPGAGAVITVDLIATGELEDPELRLLRSSVALPVPGDEAAFYSEGVLRDLGSYLPEVAVLFPAALTGGWTALGSDAKQAVRDNYHLYLLLKEHTRRFLLETNNLVIDIEVGQTPALEEFKRLHRAVDVFREIEEAARRSLENLRRSELILAGTLGDPDIEQVTVVGSSLDVAAIVVPVPPTPAPAAGPATTGGNS